MTHKEFKRLYDKHRITMINGANQPPLPKFLTTAEDAGIYDLQYRYFGNSCDRFIRQQPITHAKAN